MNVLRHLALVGALQKIAGLNVHGCGWSSCLALLTHISLIHIVFFDCLNGIRIKSCLLAPNGSRSLQTDTALLFSAVFGTCCNARGVMHAVLCLQAGDDKFKAELGWVVNLDMWEAAKQLAAQKLKDFAAQLASVTSQEQLRLTDLNRLDSQVLLHSTCLSFTQIKAHAAHTCARHAASHFLNRPDSIACHTSYISRQKASTMLPTQFAKTCSVSCFHGPGPTPPTVSLIESTAMIEPLLISQLDAHVGSLSKVGLQVLALFPACSCAVKL